MASSDGSQKKSWFEGMKAEFHKIIWPSQADLKKQSVAVLVCSVILGITISLLDFIMQHGIDFLIGFKF